MHLRVDGLPARLLAVGPLLVVLLLAVPAQAHTGLVSSSPGDGERLDAEPSHVVLEFAAPVSADDSSVRVLDGQGAERAEAVLLSHSGHAASVLVAPGGEAGRWQVRYEVRGEDGHVITGSLGFGVDASAARSTAAVPVLPATATAAAALVAGVLVLRRWARRSPEPAE